MIGALIRAIVGNDSDDIQPVKANFGILPPLENPKRSKKERAAQYVERALRRYDLSGSRLEPESRQAKNDPV